jgi:hypothetical protein
VNAQPAKTERFTLSPNNNSLKSALLIQPNNKFDPDSIQNAVRPPQIAKITSFKDYFDNKKQTSANVSQKGYEIDHKEQPPNYYPTNLNFSSIA